MNSCRPSRRQRQYVWLLAALTVGGGGACTHGPAPGAVTPAEIPALLAQAQQRPQDAPLRFRLAAALAAAGRCDTAAVVVRAAQLLAADNVVGPLVVGSCQESAGRYDLAVVTYNDFVAQHATAAGLAAVRARAQLALRAGAEQTARQALAHEAELAQQPPAPSTLAVLPLVIAGDSSVQPLARGLAELITTDLAVIRTLRLLERLQIGTVLDELKLAESARVDPATAARVGRLLRAERMVQGVAAIPPQGTMRLSASVVTGTGVVRSAGAVTGPFKSLLGLEKELVFDLSGQLGIQLTPSERERILKQGPRNLAAFLAYSEGLDAMDRGDYAAAAQRFGAAAHADPSFSAAKDGQEAAQATPAAQQTAANVGGVVTVVEAAEPATGGALGSATTDVAPSISDVLAQTTGSATTTGTTTTQQQVTSASQGVSTIVSASGTLIIIFRRPP